MEPVYLRVRARIPSKSNSYRTTRNGGLRKTDAVKSYEEIVVGAATQARLDRGGEVIFPAPEKVQVTVHWRRWRHDCYRRDLENCLKATFDAITAAGIWSDDSQINQIIAHTHFDQAEEGDECLTLELRVSPDQSQPSPRPRKPRPSRKKATSSATP